MPILPGIVQYGFVQAGVHSYYGGTVCQSCPDCTECFAAGWPAQLLQRHRVPILLGIVQYVLLMQAGRPSYYGDTACQSCRALYTVQYVLLQAGRHSYYGGTACQSCRAFFRRSVQSRGHTHFSCRDQQDCPLDYRYSSILQYTKNCCTQCTLYSYSLQLRIMLEFMQALKTATVSHPNLKHQNKF